MKRVLPLIYILLLFGCGDSDKDIVFIQPIVTPLPENIPDTLSETKDTTELTYPSFFCLDGSWHVAMDVQEGFFISYTIHYDTGKDTTIFVADSLPISGGVEHPEPHFINDTTYFAPNISSSKKGHFQAYIYKDGSNKYIEVTNALDTLKVYK
jgi:hypothetical protein